MSSEKGYKISLALKKEGEIVCNIYTGFGEYGKPFLYITNNSSGTDYFKPIAGAFEHKMRSIGLDVPMCYFAPTSRSYRLSEMDSIWNSKEQRWYDGEELHKSLDKMFQEIKEDFDQGKFDEFEHMN